ncbi:hypothetical protein NQ176_g2968 [Zarea fungicola]|uniref:Uncharacterized protein n=1 Tax=Zarea fungicola TaxID=93591 RepID=A0ACC1NKQ1_9HYPO|nr:hypothetical protein NQ176_g2968 [Lecanicillium fungicola]
MVAWFNWTTFDIIGDLVFNWSFDCLRNEAYHEWIPFILTSIKTVIISSELCRYPGVAHLLKWMFRSQMLASRQKALAFTADRVSHRITSPTEDRMDFLGYILRHESKETGMSRAEIEATANVLVLAGSETTATLLAGAVYYLIANPHVKQRLMSEIREVFVKEEEITISSVSKLPFLQAVLEEVLRIYPPVTLGSPRLVGYRGAIIAGHVVPPKTVVVDSRYAAAHSPRNFRDPESFVPERWLDDPAYKNDDRAAAQPFSLGPRNCIGKNLAYAEMRLILTRVIWNFNLEGTMDTCTWLKRSKTFSLWEKPPLLVQLTPVVRQ